MLFKAIDLLIETAREKTVRLSRRDGCKMIKAVCLLAIRYLGIKDVAQGQCLQHILAQNQF